MTLSKAQKLREKRFEEIKKEFEEEKALLLKIMKWIEEEENSEKKK